MQTMTPIRYHIVLEPDLSTFRFKGSASIEMALETPAVEISLNALDLALWSCRLVTAEGEKRWCAFSVDPEHERLLVRLPEQRSGRVTLVIEYEGQINDKLAGLYRSQSVFEGLTQPVAITQLEESDARRVFPCMDHPGRKAVFDITLVVDQGLQALSNMPICEEQRLAGGKKRVRFHPTPKMSTYLVFIGIGWFDMVQADDEQRVRMFTVPGMTQYAKLGLTFGKQSLEFCERYFDFPYPLPKMDLIAVPDFAFGAMENWGAITFRENLLLDYPNITSAAARERICEIIAHEIVHQWFGNLVTPSDWKYLWLNESFATYIAYMAVDHYYPQWNAFDQFMFGNISSAMERDAMTDTTPIEIKGGEHVVINSGTAPIIYSKGGCILRQIEGYIGEKVFQQGLQAFLKKFAYQCAASRDFWETLESSTGAPIMEMMAGWVSQPGFPIIEVNREGDCLRVRQSRFSWLPNQVEQVWPIPLTIDLLAADGACHSIKKRFDTVAAEIRLEPQTVAYKLNHHQTGFYRVYYLDQANFNKLGELVRKKALAPVDRWGLEYDLFALAKSGKVKLADYFAFLENYREETDFLPLMGIAKNLTDMYLCVTETIQGKIAGFGRQLFEAVLGKIGCESAHEEPHSVSLLRERLMYSAVYFGSEPIAQFCRKKFQSLAKGHAVHADIVKSVCQAAALNGADESFQWLTQRFRASASEQERMTLLLALGCVREPDIVRKVQTFIIEEIPDRNKFVAIAALAANVHALPSLWEFFTAHLSKLERLHPMHFERVIESVTAVSLDRVEDINPFFSDYARQHPKLKEVIALSLEKLAINRQLFQVSRI